MKHLQNIFFNQKHKILIPLSTSIFIFFLNQPGILCQENKLRFQSIQEGLSSKFVQCILKDSKGFMWFGTYNGLNKFDGTNFTVYEHNPSDSNSLSHSLINTITEDRDHNIWIGTAQGLNRYNRQADNFTNIDLIPGNIKQLNNACVTALYIDSNANVWIGTYGGAINIYNVKNLEFEYLSVPNFENEKPESRYITCIVPEENGKIWVGTRKGLFLVNTNSRLSVPYLNEPSTVEDLTESYISGITKNNKGEFWVSTSNHGLLLLQKKTKTDSGYLYESNYEFNFAAKKNVKAICCDQSNKLWIGTENGGLAILDSKTNKTYFYLPEEGYPYSITSNSIWSIYIDNDEKAWVGTYNKGICLVDPQFDKFESYFRNPFLKNTLADNDITCFTEDNHGNIWIATDGGGLNVFDPVNKKFTKNIRKESSGIHLVNNAVRFVMKDSKNNLWIGSWGGGIDKINSSQNNTTNYPVISGGVGDNNIFCLLEDSKKNIWAGSAGSGLFLLDKNKDRFVPANDSAYGIIVPSTSFVTSILEDSDQTIWVGTLYGLFSMQKTNGNKYSCKSYHISNEPDSISSNLIQVVFEDSKKNLWFGTFDNGLNLFDKNMSSFKTFRKEDGLASNMVNGILEDNSGNLWVSSNKGITQFDPINGTSLIYTKADGLISDLFYLNSCLKTSKGEFFFGGDYGFNSFSPDSISRNPIKPIMYLTDFKINNKSVKIGTEESPLTKHISETRHIVLSYKQTSFTIDFVGVSYTRPSCNSYEYKLIGFDKEWNAVGNKTSAVYTNLNPGEYHFKVKGANNDGLWNNKTAEVFITIEPPFWKTWWAYSLYLIFIILIIVVIFQIRIERIHMQHSLTMERMAREKEHELNQSKLQFFTNISHEFRTPLSLIVAPLESIIASVNTNMNLKSKIFNVYKNANRLMQLVNELMDFRKIENNKMRLKVQKGDIIKFLSELSSSFQETSSKRNISFKIDTTEESFYGWFDSNKLEKIILNLLSNAFKYTPDNGNISIEIRKIFNNEGQDTQDKELVSIAIKDNGPGILSEDMPHIFERFYQAKSSTGKGTGLGLALVKNLVEVYHGSIEVKSIPNLETQFIVTLPISKVDFAEEELVETPVDIDVIDRNIYKEEEFVADGSPRNDDAEKPEILIVEDNDDLRKYLVKELGYNFRVSEAKDGNEGKNIAFIRIPDLILSDVMMPRLNGIELCKALKEDIRTSHIPVVLLTAKTTIDDQIEGLEKGADVYITKPFSMRFLATQIKRLIENREILYKIFSHEVHIIPSQLARNKLDEIFLKSIIDYIVENITNSQIGVEAIADFMNISRGQFYKKVKALSGQTAVEFIRSIRLKQAVKLMETRKFTLAEIAYQTGFTSPSYFTRSFKEQYGKTPSEYINAIE